jgi:large subunit ribosomal protein L23
MRLFFIKHPIISEKATNISAFGKYIFLVDNKATKPEIKKAIHDIYKVNVMKVHIINIKPKSRKLGQTIGVKPGYKKAIITLRGDQKLDVLPH